MFGGVTISISKINQMIKHLTLLLFIGLAWEQVETDTSQIDYYEEGVIAAKEDVSPYYSCFAGCIFNPVISPASIIIPAIFLFTQLNFLKNIIQF